MSVYYVTFAISIIIAIVFPKIKFRKTYSIEEKRNRCMIMAFLPIAFIFLFRWEIGIDSNWKFGSYPYYYRALSEGNHIFIAEPVFEFIANLCARLGVSYFWWLFILGCIYLYAIAKFIRLKSCSYSISIFLFLITDLFFFGVGALRQALAISFLLLLYCEEDKEHKWKKMILMFLAIFSHTSAILGVLCYLFGNIKLSRKNVIYTTIGIIIISPITTYILKFIVQFSKYGILYKNSGLVSNQFAISYVVLSGSILICTILEYDYLYNEKTSRLINLLVLFFFFMINSGALIQTFRIVYYFMPAVVVLIPEIFKKSHNKLSKVILGTIATISVIFVFYNTYYINNGKLDYEKYQTIFKSLDMISKI